MSVSATATEGDPSAANEPNQTEWPTTRLPLATVTPDSATAQPAFVEGVATLLWPYSQSNATFAFVLCEEDFRLRNNKGQLKVNFRGPAAKEIHGKLQIGNKILLSLEGAELEELPDATPRDVPWALKYTHRLCGKITADSGESTVDIDDHEPSPVPLAATIDDTYEEDTFDSGLQTPPGRRTLHSQPSENEWHTPGTHKRPLERITSSPIIPRGFFGDMDVFGDGGPRKRPRFSSSFRIVDRSPSPELPEEANKAIQALNKAISASRRGTMVGESPLMPELSMEDITAMESAIDDTPAMEEVLSLDDGADGNGQPFFSEMFPPPLPPLNAQYSGSEENTEIPDSPSLRPVPSPLLPLVSPFLHKELPGSDYMSMDVDNQDFGEGAQAGINEDELDLLGYLTESVPELAPPIETPPVMLEEEVRVEEVRVEEVRVEEAQVEEAQVEEAQVEEAQVEEAQVEEAQVEEVQIEEVQVEEVQVEETQVEEMQVEEAQVKEMPFEKAHSEQPRVEEAETGPPEPKYQEEPQIGEKDAEDSKPEDTLLEETAEDKRTAPASFASSDAEDSGRDSLFDDGSDGEVARPRSKTPLTGPPLPGPSPLRRMVPAKSPESSPKNPSRLSIRTGFTPVNDGQEQPPLETPLKTPQLYLPTPSPKVALDGTQFPFTAPPKLDFAQRSFNMPDAGERRRLFRESKHSVPGGLSAYFGHPNRRSSFDHDERPRLTATAKEPSPISSEDEQLESPENEGLHRSDLEAEVDDGPVVVDAEEVDAEGYASDDEKVEEEGPEDDVEEVFDGSDAGRAEYERQEEEDDEDMEEQIHELEKTLEEELQHAQDTDDVMSEIISQEDTAMDDASQHEESDHGGAVDQKPSVQEEPEAEEESPEPRRPLAVDEFEDDCEEDEWDKEEGGLEGELESGDEEGSYDEYESYHGSVKSINSNGTNVDDEDQEDQESWDESADEGDYYEQQQRPKGFVPGEVIDLMSDDDEDDNDSKPAPEGPTEVEEPLSDVSRPGSEAPPLNRPHPESLRSDGPEVGSVPSSSLPETPKPEPAQFKSGVTTSLSDFPALVFLNWGATVDLIGVVTQTTPIARAKAGQKDFYTAMRIVDSSKKDGIVIRIFRPFESALPKVSAGDVIILRSFKIQSQKHRPMGVSNENSAWAVWHDFGTTKAESVGPPLEYGEQEEQYVEAIGRWYKDLEEDERHAMEGKLMDDLLAGVE